MRDLALNVRVETFGDRYRAIVARGAGPAGEPLSIVVRDDPHAAVCIAIEQAAHDIADELTR
jgi:hypothetical protein